MFLELKSSLFLLRDIKLMMPKYQNMIEVFSGVATVTG